MDIANFFDVKSSKKRVINSEQSETGDEAKKREAEMNFNQHFKRCFSESLKNPDCVLI